MAVRNSATGKAVQMPVTPAIWMPSQAAGTDQGPDTAAGR